MPDRPIADPAATNSLLLAVIAASDAPLVLLNGSCEVMATSTSFSGTFQAEPERTLGQSLFAIGNGEWDVLELRSLVEATMSGVPRIGSYEMDLVREGRSSRRLMLSAERLVYSDLDNIRILLTIADVTEARLAEKLRDRILEEKTILLQELQHRVANSLQIIASVLMQSARRVQSEETRSHLVEAHDRVMSVAAIQRHLAAASVSDVEMRSYLTELCQSIAASMIGRHQDVALKVDVDDSVSSGDFSMSIGLVVTELLINALKHAFPAHRSGTINVTYNGQETAWTLCVTDDGVGMPIDPLLLHAGLGTSIVGAIAHRLSARVEREDAKPGTKVTMFKSGGELAKPTLEAA